MQEPVRRPLGRIEATLQRDADRHAAAAARMARSDARFEKWMRGCEKLAQIGRKEIGELRRLHRQTDVKFKALLEAQRRTQASLDALAAAQRRSKVSLRAFLDSIRCGGKGHGRRKR